MDDLQVEMRSTGFEAAFKNVNEFEYNIKFPNLCVIPPLPIDFILILLPMKK